MATSCEGAITAHEEVGLVEEIEPGVRFQSYSDMYEVLKIVLWLHRVVLKCFFHRSPRNVYSLLSGLPVRLFVCKVLSSFP